MSWHVLKLINSIDKILRPFNEPYEWVNIDKKLYIKVINPNHYKVRRILGEGIVKVNSKEAIAAEKIMDVLDEADWYHALDSTGSYFSIFE